MRSTLAEKLLTKIMEWTPEEIDRERPLLQAMANLKWNEYQQFAPGTRFFESLVKWLQQFATLQHRRAAYRLVRDHLIFISSEQMGYLVESLFSEKINHILIHKTANEKQLATHLVKKILNEPAYGENLRKSMFVGLSDGSRIDQLRRSAHLNNEQVIATYDISPAKAKDMLEKLQKEIAVSTFETIFLVDDFTASGKTYCRADGGGKLGKIFQSIFSASSDVFHPVVNVQRVEVHILFYIATADALNNIRDGIRQWQATHGVEFTCTVDCLLLIDSTVKEKILADPELVELMVYHFDEEVVDEHYRQGKHDEPYLGFNECGLPLVLHHNSPNNSIAVLWLPSDKKYRGLFPRISRHTEK